MFILFIEREFISAIIASTNRSFPAKASKQYTRDVYKQTSPKGCPEVEVFFAVRDVSAPTKRAM
jgi:hypothetical protein